MGSFRVAFYKGQRTERCGNFGRIRANNIMTILLRFYSAVTDEGRCRQNMPMGRFPQRVLCVIAELLLVNLSVQKIMDIFKALPEDKKTTRNRDGK